MVGLRVRRARHLDRRLHAARALDGVLGLPAAFAVARSLHQSAAQALAVSGTASSSGVSLVLIAPLEGVEYGRLGRG